MTGKKGKSGRRKAPGTIVKEAYDIVDSKLPDLFEALIKKAEQGDREALIYLIDRRLGKPTQQTSLEIEGVEKLGQGTIVTLFQLLAQERARLQSQYQLPEGDNTT